jgi:hypothetical protein
MSLRATSVMVYSKPGGPLFRPGRGQHQYRLIAAREVEHVELHIAKDGLQGLGRRSGFAGTRGAGGGRSAHRRRHQLLHAVADFNRRHRQSLLAELVLLPRLHRISIGMGFWATGI